MTALQEIAMGTQIGSSGFGQLQPLACAPDHLGRSSQTPPRPTLRWCVVLSLFTILLAGCSDAERDALTTWVAGTSEPVIVKVENFGATQMARIKGTLVPPIATQAAEFVATEAAELKATAAPWIATEAAELKATAAPWIATEAAELKETAAPWVATQAAEMLSTQLAEMQATSPPQGTAEATGATDTPTPDQPLHVFLERAQTWVDDQVSYGSGETYDGYRTDSAGYVSYAWRLDPPGLDPAGFAGDAYALHLPIEQLEPGDALNNEREGMGGHIVLFARWLDDEYTRFEAYDLSPNSTASIRELTLDLAVTGWTIAELDSSAPGPYYAQRL